MTRREQEPSREARDGFDSLRRASTFQGALALDEHERAAAAEDFGHIVSQTPLGVLRPASVEDLAVVVREARKNGLKVAIRGFGNSVYGQTQARDGIVVDMASFAAVESIDSDRIVVRGGSSWGDVLMSSLERGMTPPVVTDYLDLSVGGTLSVGGVGRTTHRYGLQVDTVLELDVVTGAGEIVTCSPSQEPDLFYAVLGGLGQCGIIARATIRLVAAPSNVRMHRLQYGDLALFLSDLARLAADGRFDSILAAVQIDPASGPRFGLELGKFYSPSAAPNDAELLAGLGYEKGTASVVEQTYREHVTEPGKQLAQLKGAGLWGVPHPWYDVFFPSNVAEELTRAFLSSISPGDMCFMVLGPINTARLTAPLARVPSGELAFVFDAARFELRGPAADVASTVAANRVLYEGALERGATLNPASAIPMTPDDWKRHFGVHWEKLAAAKEKYDPGRVLSPGITMFP